MSSSVLFDVPGPRARRRQRTGTFVGGLVVLGLIGWVLWRLGSNGQLEAERWAVLFDPSTNVPQALGEALRSGINAVPPGQAEAARALGLDFRQTLTAIILPQAFRTVVPPLGNVWIALAKNTSIAAGFAVTELAAALVRLSNQNADQLLTVFLAIVAAYLVITLPSAWLIGVIERRTAIIR